MAKRHLVAAKATPSRPRLLIGQINVNVICRRFHETNRPAQHDRTGRKPDIDVWHGKGSRCGVPPAFARSGRCGHLPNTPDAKRRRMLNAAGGAMPVQTPYAAISEKRPQSRLSPGRFKRYSHCTPALLAVPAARLSRSHGGLHANFYAVNCKME
jgi:hypothetical protein